MKSSLESTNQDKDSLMSKLRSVEEERDKFASSVVEVSCESVVEVSYLHVIIIV